MSDDGVIRPLGSRMYVERIKPKMTPGGLHLPDTFKAGKSGLSARERMNAIPDYFLAKVLAVGPDERSGLQPGDHTFVWSYAEGDGTKLYTGESVGEKNRFFINGDAGDHSKQDHLGVAVEPDPS